MTWKTMSASSYKHWIGSGPPDIQSMLTPTRGLILNIPSITGGISTLISDDTALPRKLTDGVYDQYVYYSIEGTSYPLILTSTGNGPGLEFNNVELISELKLYTVSIGSYVISSNTFYILTSLDGINWEAKNSFSVGDVIVETIGTYSILTFKLSEPVYGKYVAIRSLNDFDVSNINGEYVRELEAYSQDGNFGSEGDTYKNYLTGKEYKKINGGWGLVFTPQEIPVHIVGDSATPPSGAGLPDGSIYFVKGVI